MTDWCILRCSGSSTLNLSSSLMDAGFEVWSPIERVHRRVRKTDKREEVQAALMPSFVFAHASHIADLVNLSRSPSLNYRVWDPEKRSMVTRGHPLFSLFRHGGTYPLIPERALLPLRAAEKRTAPKPEAKIFHAGEEVRLTEGGFEGLTGTVDSITGKHAMVVFPGFKLAVKIPTWMLHGNPCAAAHIHVTSTSSEQALSAKAA